MVGVKGPEQRLAKWFAGFFVSHQLEQRKTTMNIADVSLAIGMGLAAGAVIAGILMITWFLCVNYPRRTKR